MLKLLFIDKSNTWPNWIILVQMELQVSWYWLVDGVVYPFVCCISVKRD